MKASIKFAKNSKYTACHNRGFPRDRRYGIGGSGLVS
jgi:hypothetical protein